METPVAPVEKPDKRRRVPPVVSYPPDPPDPIDWTKAAQRYGRLGSFKAVAEELGCNERVVSKRLRAMGVRPSPPLCTDATSHALYTTWRAMIRRCTRPKDPRYANYGGRGIGIHFTWQSFPCFRTWALASGWKRGRCLVLRDPDANFGPANCQWVTLSEMLRLRTRVAPLTKHPVRAFGEEKSAWAWSNDPRCQVTYRPLRDRLRKGWPPEQAIALPPQSKGPRRGAKRQGGGVTSRIDWTEVVRLHQEEGKSVSEIARTLQIPLSTIHGGLTRSRALRKRKKGNVAHDPLHRVWYRIRMACEQRGREKESHRRPRMDPRWEEFEAFRQWARQSGYRRGRYLIRIDPNKDYTPANCRFASPRQRHRYMKPPTPLERPGRWRIRAFGVAKSPTQWSRDPRCEVCLSTLLKRLRMGWKAEEAIAWPPQNRAGAGRTFITAFGETQSLSDWMRDPRCKLLSPDGLQARLGRGVPPEEAISTPPWGFKGSKYANKTEPNRSSRRAR